MFVVYSKHREIHEYSPVYVHFINVYFNSASVVCGARMFQIKVNIKGFFGQKMPQKMVKDLEILDLDFFPLLSQ